MRNLRILLTGIVELAVLVALIWKHKELYSLGISSLFLIPVIPVFVLCHWFFLKKRHREARLSQCIRMKLFFLTGPIVILCLSVLFSISYELIKIKLAGGATKEMGIALTKMITTEKIKPPESVEQWMEYIIKKMKSDVVIYSMLLASTSLLYGSRYNSGKSNSSEVKDSNTG